MNLYRLFTRSGACYVVTAFDCSVAIAKAEKISGDFVCCWFMGGKIPANAIRL